MVNDKPVRAGEPTEAALRVLVEKIGAPYGVNVPKGGFGVNDYFARLSTRRVGPIYHVVSCGCYGIGERNKSCLGWLRGNERDEWSVFFFFFVSSSKTSD